MDGGFLMAANDFEFGITCSAPDEGSQARAIFDFVADAKGIQYALAMYQCRKDDHYLGSSLPKEKRKIRELEHLGETTEYFALMASVRREGVVLGGEESAHLISIKPYHLLNMGLLRQNNLSRSSNKGLSVPGVSVGRMLKK